MKLLSVIALATVAGIPAALLLTSARPASTVASAPAAGESLEVDPVHSTVMFKIKHLDTSYVFGRFNDVSGKIVLDEKQVESSSVEITVKTDSVDTNAKGRDDHLRSDSFFDVKTFPTATFKSKTVRKSGDRAYVVSGDLALHGVTKNVQINMEQVGTSDAMGHRTGFFGTLSLKRSDYGMKYMTDKLGDEVQLTLSVEAVAGKAK